MADHCGNIPVLRMGKPLLTTTEDYDELVEALEGSLLKEVADDEALVLMGHGSEHYANATYSQLQIKLWLAGHDDVFVTTVEGYPEFDDTIRLMEGCGNLMEGCGKKKAVLFPLMVVAGDHANNDMAGDEDDSVVAGDHANNDMAGDEDDSLKSVLESHGYEVRCIVRGMGEYPEFRELFMDHIRDAVSKI